MMSYQHDDIFGVMRISATTEVVCLCLAALAIPIALGSFGIVKIAKAVRQKLKGEK